MYGTEYFPRTLKCLLGQPANPDNIWQALGLKFSLPDVVLFCVNELVGLVKGGDLSDILKMKIEKKLALL
jgi:hypothetical protein